MELVTGPAWVGGSLNTGSLGFPTFPTVRHVDVSHGTSEIVLTGPEPARATIELWWPSWAAGMRPKLRDNVKLTAGRDGHIVTVFAGRVDGVSRRRRHAPPSEIAKRIPDPTRIWQTATVPVTLAEWWQAGSAKGYYGIDAGPTVPLWTWGPAPEDEGDGLWTPGVPVDLVVPIPNTTAAGGTAPRLLYASERLRVPGTLYWEWRVNGTFTPVSAGPLLLTGSRPADLALVCRGIPLGSTSIPDLYPPAVAAPNPRRIRPDGEWVTVTASDFRSEAARMKIGDAPYPSETPAARWDRIARRVDALGLDVPVSRAGNTWTAYGDSLLAADSTAQMLAPRDVDNQPIDDLLRECLAGLGAVPIATEAGIYPFRARRLPRVLTASGSVELHSEVSTIPASAVSSPELDLAITDVANRLRLGYVDQGDGETERTLTLSWDASIREWGEHAVSWSTSTLADAGNPTAGLGTIVERLSTAISAMANPQYRFAAPVTLTPARAEAITGTAETMFISLLNLDTRHGHPIVVEHELDDVPTDYTLRAGSIVVEDGAVTVTLEPEPAGMSGAVGLRINAIRTALPSLRLSDLDPSITVRDTLTIGVPE